MISICILKVVDPFRSLTCEYPARTALAHNLSREVVALCNRYPIYDTARG